MRKTGFYLKREGIGENVLLLHGFLEDQSIWDELVEAYKERFCFWRLDLPGHGASPMNEAKSIKDQAFIVSEFLKQKGLKQCPIIGHSLGGYIALAMHQHNSMWYSNICLLHSTRKPDSEEKKQNRLKGIQIIGKNKSRFIHQAIPSLFYPEKKDFHQQAIKTLCQKAVVMKKNTIIQWLYMMKERTESNVISSTGLYNLHYILGDKDPVLPIFQMEEELKGFPCCILNDCGHMGLIEKKELCFDAIVHFVKESIKKGKTKTEVF